MPARASSAANRPLRAPFASATPFHIESWPRRVTASGRLGVTASAIALIIWARSAPQDLGRRRRAGDRGIEGVVEALGHDAQRVVQRAMDLVAHHDRGDRVAPVRAGDLRGRQHRRDHAARMSAAARKAIIAVEIARHRGIGEGRELRQRAARGAEHARAVRGFGAQRERARDPARLRVEGRDAAGERVGDAPLAGVHGLRGQIGEAQPRRVVGDPADRCVRAGGAFRHLAPPLCRVAGGIRHECYPAGWRCASRPVSEPRRPRIGLVFRFVAAGAS